MTTAIYSKEDAFKKFKQSKGNVKLFQEDIPSKNSGSGLAKSNAGNPKRFFVLDPSVLWNKIVANRRSCFYEFWTDSMKLQFALDLDMKGVESYDESIKIVKSNIIKVCKAINDYYGYCYPISKIIVLESDSRYSVKESSKYSYRVIFRGVNFANHLVAKDFYQRAHAEHNIEFSDVSIYNMTCLRLCYSAKYGKNAIMIPIELKINGSLTMTDMNCGLEPYTFWLKTLITHTHSAYPEITVKQMVTPISKMKVNIDISSGGIANTNVTNVNLEEILFQLPSDYYDDYSKWLNIGMALSSLDTEETKGFYFDLWDRWSRQSAKYDGSIMLKTWTGFKRPTSGKKLGIGSLIKWCKDEGIVNIFKSKSAFSDIVNSYPVKPIGLDIQSVPANKLLELNQEKLVPEVYKPYLSKRLICVQSEKGTGKTTNLFEALFDPQANVITPETTMLFVSSRRTFGVKLLGDLQRFGFKLYSDITEPDIYAKRIICQIDSLGRLSRDTYDYVIVDECESLARYITSTHFTKNPKANITVSKLEMRIEDAKKVIIMDADLSDRCMEFYKRIIADDNLDYQLIINHFKPFSSYTIVSLTWNDWVRKVLEAIGENKKIVVPMASNNKAKDLKTKIEQDYPDKRILLIHKETDDHEKVKNLLNVNNTWGLYDVIIYTPSVCMGVSYDIPDTIDSIYAYGCENSLGAQEFCQMLHRVRKPINKTIYLSMNLYKEYDEVEDTMTYESVEQILCSDYYLTHYELHNNLVPIKIKKDKTSDNPGEQVINYPYKFEPIYDLFVRNSWENIENRMNFSASFYGYAKFKEYKMDFFRFEEKDSELIASMKEIKQSRETQEKEASVQGILDAPDITKEEFIGLLKQKDEFLEDKDVQAINRYRFKNCYKLDEETELTHGLVDEFNTKDKMKWYYNLTNILGTDTQTSNDKLEIIKSNIASDKWINSCYMEFTTRNTYTNHLYALNIIKLCGFDLNNLEAQLSQSELDVNVMSCINYIDCNKKEISYKFNLKSYNKNIIDMDLKDQIKIINSVIGSQYGMKIKKITKSIKDKTPEQIMYALIDDNMWEGLPKEIKLQGLELYDETGSVEEKRQYNLALLDFMNEDDDDIIENSDDILPCEGEEVQ